MYSYDVMPDLPAPRPALYTVAKRGHPFDRRIVIMRDPADSGGPLTPALRDTVLVHLPDFPDHVEPIRPRYLTRTFRTLAEEQLGREYTPEEMAAVQLLQRQETAQWVEKNAREHLLANLEMIAHSLERCAADIRHIAADGDSNLARKAEAVQHSFAWMIPNADVHGLTREAIRWTQERADLDRYGAPPVEAAEPTAAQG